MFFFSLSVLLLISAFIPWPIIKTPLPFRDHLAFFSQIRLSLTDVCVVEHFAITYLPEPVGTVCTSRRHANFGELMSTTGYIGGFVSIKSALFVALLRLIAGHSHTNKKTNLRIKSCKWCYRLHFSLLFTDDYQVLFLFTENFCLL